MVWRRPALLAVVAVGVGAAASPSPSLDEQDGTGVRQQVARVSGNAVSLGNVRITVHSESMLRAEWSATGAFEDRPSVTWLNRSVSAPFTHSTEAGALVVRTAKVELRHVPHNTTRTPTLAPLSADPVPHFGPGALHLSFVNLGKNQTWSSTDADSMDSCRISGHDRRPCGGNSINESACASLGCCFRNFSEARNRAEHGKSGPTALPACYHSQPVGKANLNSSNDVFDCYAGSKDCSVWYPSRMAQGLVSRDGWAVHDDGGVALLDENQSWIGSGGWRVERPYSENYRDWMIFAHGEDYRAAMRDFVRVAGPIAMMDYNAYGVWYSKYWKPGIDEKATKAILAEYKRRELPLHALVLDVGWHIEEEGAMAKDCKGYGGYTWNNSLFPDPRKFTDWLHDEQHMKLMVNTHDYIGLDPCQAFYTDIAQALGVDPATNATIQCAWTNRSFTNAVYRHALDARTNGSVSGIDYLWTDYDAQNKGYMGTDDAYWFQCPFDSKGGSPLLWSTHVHVRRAEALSKRGLVMTPMGGLGQHRYPLAGSGDTAAAWATLAYQIYQSATAANVGVHWSHDLGGFESDQSNTRPDWPHTPDISGNFAGFKYKLKMCSWPELWLRWIQFGVMSPVFRTHCNDGCSCQPWDYMVDATYEAAITAAFQLREQLMPYIYTSAHEAYTTGVTINHPVYYDYAAHDEAFSETQHQSYLFGPSVLVAAIAHAGATPSGVNNSAALRTGRTIWIPPGEWYSWCQRTARLYNGPATVSDRFHLDEIPAFVRAGSILPMRTNAEPAQNRSSTVTRLLVWKVFPAPSTGADSRQGSGRLYEDSGEGVGYRADTQQHQEFRATQTTSAKSVNVMVEAVLGGDAKSFAPAVRTQQIELLSLKAHTPANVLCNGQHMHFGEKPGWQHQQDGPWHVLAVRCPELVYTQKLQVDVEWRT